MEKSYKLIKYGCYATNVAMAAVCNISPLLFATFKESFNISYAMLGLLVIFNFCSQLAVDLIFSFFSKHFNIPLTVRLTPIITIIGLLIYSIMPMLFPENAYFWIVIGTVIFSIAAGLCEVLISPTIAAIPSDNPDKEMSKLHSVYAWGVFIVVLIAAIFIKLVGTQYWSFLALLFGVFPLTAFICFMLGKMPEMKQGVSGGNKNDKGMLSGMIFFVLCIFLGGATENTMSQWCSDYVETAMGISKLWGDIFGIALFAVMLGLGRTLYARKGKKIYNVMLLGFVGAVVTYLVAGVSGLPVIGLIACALTGLCSSMLWPGTIIWMESTFAECGVVAYALLAAGGDMGSSVAPQLMGIVTDAVASSELSLKLCEALSLTQEQIGLKVGMLVSMIFPLAGIVTVLIMKKKFLKK